MADDEERDDEQEQDQQEGDQGHGEERDDEQEGSGGADSGDDDSGDDDDESGDDDSGEDDSGDDASGDDDDDSGDDSGEDDSGEDEEAARPSISAKEMTQAAMEALKDLTGHEPEGATGLMWDGESWLVTVDVLELSRIPNTTDLLGTYVVQLDGDGNLSGYKRTRRFQRGQAEESQA